MMNSLYITQVCMLIDICIFFPCFNYSRETSLYCTVIYSSETSLTWLQIIHFIPTTYTSHSGPGVPTGVTVQAQSCHTLKVTWSSPNHTGGLPITGYNVSYTDTLNNKMLRGYSNTTVISLQQLIPGTKYIVRVRAMNAIGEGDFTQHSGRTYKRR